MSVNQLCLSSVLGQQAWKICHFPEISILISSVSSWLQIQHNVALMLSNSALLFGKKTSRNKNRCCLSLWNICQFSCFVHLVHLRLIFQLGRQFNRTVSTYYHPFWVCYIPCYICGMLLFSVLLPLLNELTCNQPLFSNLSTD